MNGVKTEEASVVRPVSVQQRNRLSFLNKRKISDPPRESLVNGDVELPRKETPKRASFFRVQSADDRPPADQPTFDDRRPSETSDKAPSLSKKGSVRKRLSMLKLGGGKKNSSKQGAMGSLDEE